MPAGIVVALPAEARTLSRVSQPGDAVRLGEHSLLIVSGMGARRAGKAARALLHAGATALVSWGTAGGLDPKYRSGHLLVSEKILTTSGEHYLADQAWRTRVLQTLSDHIDCSDGNVVTTGQVLTSAADRRRLHAQSGAAAVDLESSAIAASARSAGVPFLALRAVADRAGATLPRHVLEQIDPYGRPHVRALLTSLARHPEELVGMVQLFIDFRTAQATLRQLSRLLGCDLLGPEAATAASSQ